MKKCPLNNYQPCIGEDCIAFDRKSSVTTWETGTEYIQTAYCKAFNVELDKEKTWFNEKVPF